MTLITLGQYAGAAIAILTFIGMIVRYAIVIPIKLYIDKMTYAIQPHANGGKSLPDLIIKVDELRATIQQHIRQDHDTPVFSKCLCESCVSC
jgi:hypothetical protein